MSFTQIWGNFQLTRHYRKNPVDENADNLGYHLHYEAFLSTNSGNITINIRVYQPVDIRFPPYPDGTIAMVFGRFFMGGPYNMQIEAIHICKYDRASALILRAFSPRITISGHVIQEVQQLRNGTKLVLINSMGFVRDHFQTLTVFGAMAPNDRWPIAPPTPKPNSAIHITGFIDCIDNMNGIPVITIEDLTLEIGNRRVAELANTARIQQAMNTNQQEGPAMIEGDITPIQADRSWRYEESRVSLSSVPPYSTPYPIPFPLLPPSRAPGEPKPLDPGFDYPELAYPATLDESDKAILNEMIGKDGVDEAVQASPSGITVPSESDEALEFPYPSSQAKAPRSGTLPDGEIEEATAGHASKKPTLNDNMVYLEDIPVVQENNLKYSRKRRDMPKTLPSRSSKRIKLLSTSQKTLNAWVTPENKCVTRAEGSHRSK
ncbi:hypothetical protein M422DRAFT_275676 [Sphaerobolus stellatus SS14]|uniref:Uncharacterized protein n=1 Tax=Sphaerobolus stellatus (strain SS14) TaxID=990650 RepID=A0A0C9U3J5_SPHS4|nr:hypothetical protein M422DRAFT_275676 [Sphaerobolus stellatus SS14]